MAFGYREATAQEITDQSALIVPSEALLPDQRAFLNGYIQAGTIRGAQRLSKIHHLYHYQWLEDYANYQAAFVRIVAIIEAGNAEGIKTRAVKGWLEPLSYKGMKTGQAIRRYDSALSALYLKGVDPKFRDGAQIAVGPAKIEISIVQTAPAGDANTIEINPGSKE